VLEVKGETRANLGGRSRPLRTLQALPKGTVITVNEGAELRLTYLGSGLRETVNGPLKLVTGSTSSTGQEGAGTYTAQVAAGSTTLVPKSENMRRMGGAKHAFQETDALGLVAYLPDPLDKTRWHPKPRIQDHTPSLREVPPGHEIRWSGGEAPYTVRLERDDGKVQARQQGKASALVLPKLDGGHVYTLKVKDSKGAEADVFHFYVLTPAEVAEVETDLSYLGSVEAIAYLEARGLWEEALPLAEKAVEASPDDVGLLTTLGRLQLVLGQTEKADLTLHRALELETGSPK
jgi:hypothetical protein